MLDRYTNPVDSDKRRDETATTPRYKIDDLATFCGTSELEKCWSGEKSLEDDAQQLADKGFAQYSVCITRSDVSLNFLDLIFIVGRPVLRQILFG